MRVAGAVARFGPAAVPTVVALLKSPDGEKRKLGGRNSKRERTANSGTPVEVAELRGSEKWDRDLCGYVARNGEGSSRQVKRVRSSAMPTNGDAERLIPSRTFRSGIHHRLPHTKILSCMPSLLRQNESASI